MAGFAGIVVSGASQVVKALEAKQQQIAQGTVDGINETAIEIRTDAVKSMQAGGGKGRNPSAPGGPPHVQTGRLRTSAAMDPATVAHPEAKVEFATDYAVPLEFGTSKMAARPFMQPAVIRKGPNLPDNIRKRVARRLGS